ncbi:MAG: hypothetical protein ABII85_01645 [Bacillota bacterium]
MPKNNERHFLSKKLDDISSKLHVKDVIKDIFGTNTQSAFKSIPSIAQMIKNDIYLGYLFEAEFHVFGKDELKIIINPQKGNTPFFEIIEELKKSGFHGVSDIELLDTIQNPNITVIQKSIIENNLPKCPVCYGTINKEQLLKIQENILLGDLEPQMKSSILYYLGLNNEVSQRLARILTNTKDIDIYQKEDARCIESSIYKLIEPNFQDTEVTNFKQISNSIKEIDSFIDAFSIKNAGMDTIEYFENEIKKHKKYSTYDFKVQLNKGIVNLSNLPIPFSSLSTSEKNHFKIIYFKTLIREKSREGELNIIVDDPFDSYDDIYVQDSIQVLTDSVSQSFHLIKSCYVFSHSTYVLNLYKSIQSINDSFVLNWLDIMMNTNELIAFTDQSRILDFLQNNTADFGLALNLKSTAFDVYSFLVITSMLRNESFLINKLSHKALSESVSESAKAHKNFYLEISNNINHLKSNKTIQSIYASFCQFYGVIEEIDIPIGTVEDVFKTIDPQNYLSITIKSRNISQCDRDVSQLFIYKYLMGLKCRRLLEEKCRAILPNATYKALGELIKQISEVNHPELVEYYNSHFEILNSFSHSNSRHIPPILVYSLETIQKTYIEINSLK